MDFDRTTQRLMDLGVSLQEQGHALGVAYSTVRAMRLDPGSASYRRPPDDWPQKLVALAEERGRELQELAGELRKERESMREGGLMGDDLVRARMNQLAAQGFPVAETVEAAEQILKYAGPSAAKPAIKKLVAELPEEDLREVVRVHVMQQHRERPGSYSRHPFSSTLLERLKSRGYAPMHDSEWRLTSKSGEVLHDKSLSRLALLAVWLDAIAERGARGNRPLTRGIRANSAF